jgi:CRP-like cAMP-binding protein
MIQLSLIEKAFLLKKNRIFSMLDLDLLLPIADKLSSVTLEAREILFDVGEQAFSMFLIVKGTVVAYNEKGEELASMNEGQFFGDEAIFSGTPRSYRIFTQTPTQCLTLSHSDLLAIINEYPQVSTGFLEVYAKAMPFRRR